MEPVATGSERQPIQGGGREGDHVASWANRARTNRISAALVALATIASAACYFVGYIITDDLRLQEALPLAGAFVGFGLVGAVILRQDARHRMGWLFAWIAIAGSWSGIAVVLTANAGFPLFVHMGSNTAWWAMILGLFVLLPLWFPTGYPVSPRWRWVAWLGIAATIGVIALDVLAQSVCVHERDSLVLNQYTCLEWAQNPIGISGNHGSEQSSIGVVLFLFMLAAFVGALASVVVRFRRSSGVERRQLKWFAYAMGILIVWVIITDWFVTSVLGIDDSVLEDAGSLGFAIVLTAVPISAGLAILKYRLYDIDRIVNRAVVYAVVVGVLLVVFVAGSVWIPTALATGDSSLAVAATTLVVFFLFQPLRRRVQVFVNSRFYRSRYDPQQVADEFSVRLRDEVDPDVVAHDWLEVVNRTMQPSSVGVWVQERNP